MNTEIKSFAEQMEKGILASLLAGENIQVFHDEKVKTASFDPYKRVLVLPVWKVPNTVYNTLVGHECGHALFTPANKDVIRDAYRKVLNLAPNEELNKKNQAVAHMYLNIVEDVRIDEAMVTKLSLIHISEPTRPCGTSRMPSSA